MLKSYKISYPFYMNNKVPEKYSAHVADLGNGLFLGSWYSATNHTILKTLNINQVVCITINPHPLLKGVDYKLLDFDDNAQSASKLFDEILPDILIFINKTLSQNKNVLVNCSAGKSRSATIVIAYLMKYRNMLYQDALDYITERRVINPNPGFREGLKTFEKTEVR